LEILKADEFSLCFWFNGGNVQGYGKLEGSIDLMSDYLRYSRINLISRRNYNARLKTLMKCTLEAVLKSI